MGKKINEDMAEEQAAKLSVEAVKELIADLKIPSLKEMGVDKKRLSEVAADGRSCNSLRFPGQ